MEITSLSSVEFNANVSISSNSSSLSRAFFRRLRRLSPAYSLALKIRIRTRPHFCILKRSAVFNCFVTSCIYPPHFFKASIGMGNLQKIFSILGSVDIQNKEPD